MPDSKIIIVGPTPPPYGGVAIYVSALYRFVRERGVRLWTYSDEQQEDENIRFLKPFGLKMVTSLIRDAVKARIIDSSYFAIEHPHKFLLPAWFIGKLLLRFEWVKIFHDGSLPSRYPGFTRVEKMLVRAAMNSVTEFIVVNEQLRTWLRDQFGVTQKISVISSLLPLPPDAFEASLHKSLDKAISRHAKRICSIGVFIPGYGFKAVADAVAQIRAESGEDIGLVLVDCGYMRNPKFESEVFGGRDWITVVANVPQSTVFQLLKRSDVFVRAFGLESYGLSRVEALWCGIPVVATRAGETRGMHTYDYGDQEGLVKQMKAALHDSNKQETIHWSAVFQKEAEENLQKLVTAIGLKGSTEP